jgi:hypothetical protein
MRGFKESLGGESAQPEVNPPSEISAAPAGAPAVATATKPVAAAAEEPQGPIAA